MPKLDLTAAKRIKVASGEVVQLKGVGFEWVKPSAESALQQAVIAAWDMQEESGPLLPAKGGIEIPAFNSPGTTTGPATGISARRSDSSQNASFELPDDEIFRFPASGQKTIRIWIRYDDVGFESVLFKGSASAGGEWNVTRRNNGLALQLRLADDSDFERVTSLNTEEWRRLEVVFDAESNTATKRFCGEVVSVTNAVGFRRANNPFRLLGGIRFKEICLLAIIDRALTTEERTADMTPRLFSQL